MGETAKPDLAAGTTALLVIDVQKGLFDAEEAPHQAEQVIDRINSCVEAFHESGAPVFLVQHDGSDEDGVAPGSEGWKFHPRLRVQPEDIVIRKTTCDAFYATDLDEQLRRKGIRQLVISGYATEFCVEATVRTACSRDYDVWVVEDAHTTNDSPVLQAAEIIAHHNHTWPECAAKKPIRLVSSKELADAMAPA